MIAGAHVYSVCAFAHIAEFLLTESIDFLGYPHFALVQSMFYKLQATNEILVYCRPTILKLWCGMLCA